MFDVFQAAKNIPLNKNYVSRLSVKFNTFKGKKQEVKHFIKKT